MTDGGSSQGERLIRVELVLGAESNFCRDFLARHAIISADYAE
jgi:hypothetical protein